MANCVDTEQLPKPNCEEIISGEQLVDGKVEAEEDKQCCGESSASCDASPLVKLPDQHNEKSAEKVRTNKVKDKINPSKMRTKEDKSIEHILKALNSLHTTEEKLAALCKKYADLMEEHRNVQLLLKQSERKNQQLIKEKDQIQTEHSKAVLTRSRLESLCRELQRQNKVVKDESLMRVREEEEKRKEVSAKFQTTFNEISSMMQDNNQKSSKLREENMELATKLKSLVDQYEMREQQVENLVKHKEIEAQLAEAKLAKANVLMNEEKEKFIQEKHKLLLDLTEYQKKCHEMTTKEVRLRTQLNLYTEKYEEFQATITKSNDVFTHFKEEMDKMSKKIKKLEKETGSWRTRWEGSNKALLEMAADKQRHDGELTNAQKKILQLEKLCRAMQVERQSLLAQLKPGAENNEKPSNNHISGDGISNDVTETLIQAGLGSICNDDHTSDVKDTAQHSSAVNSISLPNPATQDETFHSCDKHSVREGKGRKKNKGKH